MRDQTKTDAPSLQARDVALDVLEDTLSFYIRVLDSQVSRNLDTRLDGLEVVRGKGKFIHTEYVATEERTGARFPLLLTTGRILSQYNVGAQTRRTDNVAWHAEDVLEIHPSDAENRGVRDGDWVRVASRSGDTSLRALITERVAPGVVYTTFHHPTTQANVVTTDNSDWATNCPEFKVTAVQVSPSNGPSDWQEEYQSHSDLSRRILPTAAE